MRRARAGRDLRPLPRPASPGVSDLRATGHSSLGGASVWMRFRATERAVASLTRAFRKLPPDEARETVRRLAVEGSESIPTPPASALSEEHWVHWDELERIRDSAAYEKPREHSGSSTILVVDPDHRLAYFYHWSQ